MGERAAPDAIVRRARVATWIAVATLGALARVRPSIARTISFALVGTLGIAHGATDATLLERVGYRPRGGRFAVSATYGSLAVATFVLARRHPDAAGRALFWLSWLHFGSGDAAFARACGSRANFSMEAALRGAIPLCVAETDPRSLAVGAAAGIAALAHAARGEFADAIDLALPASLLLATPERFGFSIYFGAWHAVRHTAMILERDPRGGSLGTRAARFAKESVGNVAIALAAGALAFLASPKISRREAAPDNEDVFGALILAITVPHQLAVWLFERRTAG